MSTPNNSARDLARLIYASLRDRRRPPSLEALEELFQVLFLASLETEEGASPRCVDLRDTVIACIAQGRRATIATRNTRHFEGLEVPVGNPWHS